MVSKHGLRQTHHGRRPREFPAGAPAEPSHRGGCCFWARASIRIIKKQNVFALSDFVVLLFKERGQLLAQSADRLCMQLRDTAFGHPQNFADLF
jgi:hypothetical protein